ncbi:hypothetical protein JRQ81_012943 [Phrynocephalus forsythii]|uniref:Uncharacterized protein n=1 Tax=Phrynocephalus forsythii TaxID=171643 RepID=A0A9Q0XYW8_9SAUR|nr:hypothetical protein JRQ81_012943 [Phrynocephalus forsythii]
MVDGEEPEKKRRRLEERRWRLAGERQREMVGMAVDGGCGDNGDWKVAGTM